MNDEQARKAHDCIFGKGEDPLRITCTMKDGRWTTTSIYNGLKQKMTIEADRRVKIDGSIQLNDKQKSCIEEMGLKI